MINAGSRMQDVKALTVPHRFKVKRSAQSGMLGLRGEPAALPPGAVAERRVSAGLLALPLL
jgi:hypothetical protein